MNSRFYLSSLGIITALGSGVKTNYDNLINGITPGLKKTDGFGLGKNFDLACVLDELPEIPSSLKEHNLLCNRFLLSCFFQIQGKFKEVLKKYGKEKIGIVIGSGTTGVGEAQEGLKKFKKNGKLPDDFSYKFFEMGNLAEFLSKYLGLEDNLYYSVSTACSSSAKALASAHNLIESGLCDAVLVGGSDNLCSLTVQGFNSLEVLSQKVCNPFSKNRNGITLGEGAALFLLTKDDIFDLGIKLKGFGESSDAYHTTSPDPEGGGAVSSMSQAIKSAGVNLKDIDYLNLHGTGTIQNDSMESFAVSALFGDLAKNLLCSSTKPLTGHTLGSAGVIEAAFCWMLLNDTINSAKKLPIHISDGVKDDAIPALNFVNNDNSQIETLKNCMSNSFAFGGSNATIIVGK